MLLAACALALLAGCAQDPAQVSAAEGLADSKKGRHLIFAHGCGSCHVIPGVARASGTIGPSLEAFGRRSFLAGTLPNRPQDLERWIIDPQSINPGTAMPASGVTGEQARHMAAYLYTLR